MPNPLSRDEMVAKLENWLSYSRPGREDWLSDAAFEDASRVYREACAALASLREAPPAQAETPDAERTFDLDEASPLERGLYNLCRELEQLPASAFQTRLSLALSTAMVELWRMRQRLANHAVQCPQCQDVALGAVTDLGADHGIECGFIGDPKQPDVWIIDPPDVCGEVMSEEDEHGKLD